QSVTYLAGGNINLAGFKITSAFNGIGGTGKGGNITLVAGANLEPAPLDNLLHELGAGLTIRVTGPSKSGQGGAITCSGCTLDAQATSPTQNGGNILMAAYKGTGSGNGSVDLQSSGVNPSLIETGFPIGSASAQAGSVTIIAPNTIRVDNVSQLG